MATDRTTRHLDAHIHSCAARHVKVEHLDEATDAYARHLRDGGHDALAVDTPDHLDALPEDHPAHAGTFFEGYAKQNPQHAKEKTTTPNAAPRRPY